MRSWMAPQIKRDADQQRRSTVAGLEKEPVRIEQIPRRCSAAVMASSVSDDRASPICSRDARRREYAQRNVAASSRSFRRSRRRGVPKNKRSARYSQRRQDRPQDHRAFRPGRNHQEPAGDRQVPDGRGHDDVKPQHLQLQPQIGLPQRAAERERARTRDDECHQQGRRDRRRRSTPAGITIRPDEQFDEHGGGIGDRQRLPEQMLRSLRSAYRQSSRYQVRVDRHHRRRTSRRTRTEPCRRRERFSLGRASRPGISTLPEQRCKRQRTPIAAGIIQMARFSQNSRRISHK